MRINWVATGLLLLAAAGYVISEKYQLYYLAAFSEAAMVGALADWFAVVALFRRPLNLPIPHTAIIPRNKQRIGQSLGRFVEQNFASPEVVSAKLTGVDLSGKLAQWLSEPERTAVFADRVISLIPQLLGSGDGHQVQHFVSDSVSRR